MIAAFAAAMLAHAPYAHANGTSKDGRFPITFRTDADVISGSVGQLSLTKADAGAGLSLHAIPRLTLYADIRYGIMRLAISTTLDDGLKGRAHVWEYGDLSAKTGGAFRLYESARWEFDFFAEYESSLVGMTPAVTQLQITNADGSFDVSPYAKRNAIPDIFWNRFAGGFAFRTHLGKFTPGLTVAYQVIDAAMDLRLKPDGRSTLERLGYDADHVERSHGMTFWSIPLQAELEYEVGLRTSIGIRGSVIPAGDSLIFGSGVYYRLRL